MIKAIKTDKAPAAIGPYSQAVVANGFVFCSGQVGINPETGTLADGIENQTHQVLKNLQSVLEEAGSSLEHIIKTTIFLTNVDDFSKVNEVYTKYFTHYKPARATVGVSSLPKSSQSTTPLIEIDATAVINS